ncbi:hypothetical protein FKW77_009490 [Venturia effusa]|uniref:Methyltransferase domain-containing protein n=1 Tax=Venturia effusa TaxID=50376 RepID=A0A517L9Y8_9PEZI|nr:hypothetical protein FKW77_009490 [Venturia effusa]
METATPIESTNDVYFLKGTRGPHAAIRLMVQHWLYKDHFGWNLHPTIRASFSSDRPIRMADIATGQATFLMEEHPHLPPGSQSFGFDISPNMFPATDTLPPGMSLHLVDAASEPFNSPACKNNDPRPFLRNALALLKPGGYLQWTDVFTPTHILGASTETNKTNPSVSRGLLDSLLAKIGFPGWEDAWMNHLPSLFEEAGLREIEVVQLGVPRREMWSSWGANTLSYLRESLGTGDKEGKGEREVLVEELEREYAGGVYAASEPRVVVGRMAERARL